MANIPTPQYGYENVKDKIWVNGTLVSAGPEGAEPAETFELDPSLPNQGTQPHPENIDLDVVKIPRGRIVSHVASRDMATATTKPLLTLADGTTRPPIGFTFENVLSPATQGRPEAFPRWRRAGYIEVPYLSALNDAYGGLVEGDYVTAYFGSTSSLTAIAFEDKGKPVKWIPKNIYTKSIFSSPSATVDLNSAYLPGIRPTIIHATNATGGVLTTTTSLIWTGSVWRATFASAVAYVIYSWGQSEDQRAGQVLRLRQVSSSAEYEGWLRWVEQNYKNNSLPVMSLDYQKEAVGWDADGTFDAGTADEPAPNNESGADFWTLSHGKILPHLKIVVRVVTGQLIDLEGNVTDISGTDLTVRTGSYFENYAVGQYYRIDFVKGRLYLSSQITGPGGADLTEGDIQVAYYYSNKYETGLSNVTGFGVGLRGQTDGRYTGLPGVPAHLERAANDRRYSGAAGDFGAMRILFG